MDARISMYIHHMTRGWPFGTAPSRGILVTAPVLPPLSSLDKMRFWLTKTFVGFNVRSNIKLDDLMALRELGVEVVRVGAASSSERTPSPDLCYLLDAQGGVRGEGLDTLALAVRQFRDHGFKLELTLARSLASPALWSALARTLAVFDNVIGYDVINEPYECNTVRQTEGGAANFKELFLAVRAQDQSTPVVLEPLEWASHDQLEQLPMELCNERSAGENLLLVAPHMYWPFPLTSRRTNAGRFSFPGKVPVYNGKHAPVVDCNDDLMREVVSGVSAWGRQVLDTPSRVFFWERWASIVTLLAPGSI